MGFGMGLLSVSSLVLIQEVAQRSERGVVTASNLFSRNLGSTLGATILGAVLNYRLSHSMGVGVITSDRLSSLLEKPSLSAAGDAAIRLALQQSLNLAFWAMLAISLLIVLMAFLVPPVTIGQARGTPAE